jgi:hypothetical protein
MTPLPRILTVDPSGSVARLVRAVIELSDAAFIQTDVPTSNEALAELSRASFDLLVTAYQLENDVDGIMLITHVQTELPSLNAIVVADEDDPELELYGNAIGFRHPLDAKQFVHALLNGVEGKDMHPTAEHPQVVMGINAGDIPALDLSAVGKIIERLEGDISPLRLILASRAGEILLERGTDNRINRDEVTQALLPAIQANIQMGALVGGKISAMNFYDGDRYDVFMLAAGYHHFLCLVFDGTNGAKQIGAVRNYAQRATLDIVALLGGQAYVLATPTKEKKARPKSERIPRQAPPPPVEVPVAVRADGFAAVMETQPELPRLQLDPIENFDPSLLDQLDALNVGDADALFDLDALGEIARSPGRERGLLSDDEARQLGIVQ